jgi:hypothetical protein
LSLAINKQEKKMSILKTRGIWKIIHRDKNGKVLGSEQVENLITEEGIDYLFNAGLHGSTAISSWYFAPWSASHSPANGNTYATPGYTEANAQYDEATRQEWGEGASSGKSITNAAAAVITANTAVTIYGCGIVGGGSAATTKANTAGGGTLFALVAFASGKVLADNETLSFTYTLTGADA